MTDPQAKAFDTWKLMAHARRDAIAVLRRGGAALRSPELRWGFKVWRWWRLLIFWRWWLHFFL